MLVAMLCSTKELLPVCKNTKNCSMDGRNG